MIERSVIMAFEDAAGKKVNVTVKDIKQDVDNEDVENLMDTIIDDALIESTTGPVEKKVAAEIVTKEIESITLA